MSKANQRKSSFNASASLSYIQSQFFLSFIQFVFLSFPIETSKTFVNARDPF